ncbi:MAG TPA: DUF4832 domain-containing protein [Paludibacter sp.]
MERIIKAFRILPFFCVPLLVMCKTVNTPNSIFTQKIVAKTFTEAAGIVPNHGQGFLSSNRFEGTIKYLRLQWEQLQPIGPGQYDWRVIDDAIKNLDLKRGESIGLRIMCCSSHSPSYYCSPKWLFDEGCKGTEYTINVPNSTEGGANILRIDPIYDDPIFLKRHAEFLKALGEKYSNVPQIDIIDIGSYGNWGEWHADHSPPVSVDIRKKFVDMYVAAFPNKKMVFMTDDDQTLPYALTFGIGLRRDGVGSPWLEKQWAGSTRYAVAVGMADQWKKAPVVFEWWTNYNDMLTKGWSFEASVNFMINNHVTVINDNIGTVPDDKMPILQNLAKIAGARIVLNSVSNNNLAKKDSTFSISLDITNKGVAKIYDKYILRFFLYDANGNIKYTTDGISNPNEWLPGNYKFTESFKIPSTLESGTYKIGVGITDPIGLLPMFKLAITLIPRDNSYIVSEVKVQ